jgi:transposase InsO family protein
MKLHGSAALSRRQRRRLVVLVGSGMTIAAAAAIVGCSRQTGSKWVNRHRRGEGLEDRSSRPHRSPRRVEEQVEQAVLAARAELQAGPHVIGWATGIAASTVHAVLRRHGCSRLKPHQPRGAVVRYERERPGELLHVDCKKLGRILVPGHRVHGDRSRRAPRGKAGWQYLFVAIDDATRLGFARIYPDETADSALAFLEACERFYRRHGIRIERVLTDNGTCFKRRWRERCDQLGIGVRKTRPYRPQTNGKAERFIRTLLERWAYAYSYPTELDRAQALPDALESYNRYRPHRALGGQTPLQRVNDLSGTNS